MDTITISIPTAWLANSSPDQEELRQALKLGLAQLKRQKKTASHRRLVRDKLIEAGLSITRSGDLAGLEKPLSAERRKELAARFAEGGALSDVIIEERGEY